MGAYTIRVVYVEVLDVSAVVVVGLVAWVGSVETGALFGDVFVGCAAGEASVVGFCWGACVVCCGAGVDAGAGAGVEVGVLLCGGLERGRQWM
jgi:hypothetical protein